MLIQIFDIRAAGKKPEKLVNDGLQVDFLRRDERETLFQIKTHLATERTNRTRACPVGFGLACL
jgi:hypothetical protein